jgi:hypothetical protein
MKRVGLLLAGVLVIVAVSRFTAVHPKAIGGPSRTAAPSVPRSSFATSVQDESRFPSRSLPAASKTVDPPDDAWRKRAYDYRERLLNLKPERTAEIEAVAPRMRLTPDTVERLSRWSDRAADLTARALSGIETKSQWELAMARAVTISRAHQNAERRLLGGLDNWNRYYRLKGASMTGHLDDVGDDGEWKWVESDGPPSDELKERERHSGPPPPIDTAEFERYFTD